MIALISIDPTFGNCPGLYKALSLLDEVQAYFLQPDPKGMHMEMLCTFGLDDIPAADHYYIVSSHAFMMVKTPPGKTTVILTDSYYLENHKNINSLLDGYRVFVMADLSKYYPDYDKIYHPPFEYHGDIVKNDIFTIAHSPYSVEKCKQKGTDIIIDACNEINLDIILDVSRSESVKRKSKAHLFIDQVTEREYGYNGALAKSGIEAMATGCVTMTSGDFVNGEIPTPPVVKVDRYNLKRKIHFLKREERIMAHLAEIQTGWVREYLNYEYQSKYLQ